MEGDLTPHAELHRSSAEELHRFVCEAPNSTRGKILHFMAKQHQSEHSVDVLLQKHIVLRCASEYVQLDSKDIASSCLCRKFQVLVCSL